MISSSTPQEKNDQTREVSPSSLIRAVMIGLLIWGTIHAIGITLFSPDPDIRKPIVVYGCVLVFLGFWSLMLWIRRRSQK